MNNVFVIFSICIPLTSCKLPDWLIKKIDYPAHVVENKEDSTLILTNGLLSKKFKLSPGFVTIDLYSHEKNCSVLRALGPEVYYNTIANDLPEVYTLM